MITVAGGDSFIWGSELADSLHGGTGGHSRNTFAALLAEENYICAAYPGIGNKEIKLKIIDVCQSLAHKSIQPVVLVCWTWPGRDNIINSDADIIELQDYLEQHNICYLFTCADNCIITDNPKIKWENWFLFPPAAEDYNTQTSRGFYQWAIENKYSVGPEFHPLELAHRDAAELIRSKFNELVEKFNQQNQIRNSLS